MFRVWISRLIAAQTIFYCRYIPPLFSSSLCSFHGLCFRRSKFSEIFVQSNILEYFLIDEERERERSNSYFFWKAISLKIRIFEIERNVWKDTRAFNKSLRRKEGSSIYKTLQRIWNATCKWSHAAKIGGILFQKEKKKNSSPVTIKTKSKLIDALTSSPNFWI